MARGSRRNAERWFLLCAVPLLLFACSGNKAVREDPPRAAAAESLFFLSQVQGNPLCMVVDISKRRSRRLFRAPRTKWRLNVWLASPGVTTSLCKETGKSKKGTTAPVFWTNEKLLFTTDKDEFVFYNPQETGKLLVMSDPIFADRVRSGQEEEIRYGRMPAKLFWNNRTVEGNLFYERRAWTDPLPRRGKGPLIGLPPGNRIYAVWGPDGQFLYLEKEGEIGREGGARFAVMQDRRGRWQETYQVRWSEPACAFSSSPCAGESAAFQLTIPAWDIRGILEKVTQIQVQADEEEEAESSSADNASSETAFWAPLRGIQPAKKSPPLEVCLLKGSIRVEENTRAVYGIGLYPRKP